MRVVHDIIVFFKPTGGKRGGHVLCAPSLLGVTTSSARPVN
jgi:hypothetical protein